MKFVRFAAENAGTRVGVVDGDTYRVVEGYDDLLPLIQAGEEALRAAGDAALRDGDTVDPASVHNLSPIATPPTFRDFYAFEQHVKAGRAWRGLEMDPLWYQIPVFYFSNPYAFRGEGEVAMTPGSESFDFELEVAAIVGKAGSDLTVAEAEDAISRRKRCSCPWARSRARTLRPPSGRGSSPRTSSSRTGLPPALTAQ
jgi:2-keto-4-pentenoate hydratase/2-oxohepta-3-ene-1,7-dioic acid hydratase in catechol pathway